MSVCTLGYSIVEHYFIIMFHLLVLMNTSFLLWWFSGCVEWLCWIYIGIDYVIRDRLNSISTFISLFMCSVDKMCSLSSVCQIVGGYCLSGSPMVTFPNSDIAQNVTEDQNILVLGYLLSTLQWVWNEPCKPVQLSLNYDHDDSVARDCLHPHISGVLVVLFTFRWNRCICKWFE
jgi:hypothetical protein